MLIGSMPCTCMMLKILDETDISDFDIMRQEMIGE